MSPPSLLPRTILPPVPLPEPLDTARGVQHALVPGPERVRRGGDVEDHEGVAAPVGPVDRLVTGHGRAGLVRGAARRVPEDDLAVLGVDALAHVLTLPRAPPGGLPCRGRRQPVKAPVSAMRRCGTVLSRATARASGTSSISVPRRATICPYAPSCAAIVACSPNRVASTRSKDVGVPPRCT